MLKIMLIDSILYFSIFLLYIYILYIFLTIIYAVIRFFTGIIFFYNIWFFTDSFIRNSPNHSSYNSDNSEFIIDFQCFEFRDIIYYDEYSNYLTDVKLDWHWSVYYDFLLQYSNVEDDEHELYAFISTYLVPLCDKYYIIEHFYPDERNSIYPLNFYDFYDLKREFSFFYEKEEYDYLIEKYRFHFNNFIKLYYKEKLNSKKILQTFSYNYFEKVYERNNVWYYFLENDRKNTFIKKRGVIPFEVLIEPPRKYIHNNINYVKFLRLRHEYDENQYKLYHYNRLPRYDIFDRDYYLIKIHKKVIDTEMKYSQFSETKDEYFFNQKNKFDHLVYNFHLGFLFGYEEDFGDFCLDEDKNFNYDSTSFVSDVLRLAIAVLRLDEEEKEEELIYDIDFFAFDEYALYFQFYLFHFLFINIIIFFIITSYICLIHSVYIVDYDFNFSYIRSLTRSHLVNDFLDFRDLIFNESIYINPFKKNIN